MSLRINKYLAAAGCASRRGADALIAAGRVSINGETLRTPGRLVAEGDVVCLDGEPVAPAGDNIYLLLNKPVGYITTVRDERGRPTVLDLLPDMGRRIFPVGRLDSNTSGLLILTDDGDLAQRILHPSHALDKTYRAQVAGTLTHARAQRLACGVDIGGFYTSPAVVEIVRYQRSTTLVDITIHEGKNHQVRRMFRAVGNPVQTLERIAIGPLVIGRLAVGQWRRLSPTELHALQQS